MVIGTAALHLFGNNAGTFIILIATAIAPVLSALIMLMAAKIPIRLALTLPDICAAGEEAQGCLMFGYKKNFFMFMTDISCRVICVNLHTGGQTQKKLRFSINKRHRAECRFSLTPFFSGEAVIKAEMFAVSDLLGLFTKQLDCTAEQKLLIWPEGNNSESRFDENPDFMADNDEYSMTHPGTDTGEIYTVRPYVPGDPIHSIHWKLTEKTDRVMVREFGKPLIKKQLYEFDSGADSSNEDSATEGSCLFHTTQNDYKLPRIVSLILAVVLLFCTIGTLADTLEISPPQEFKIEFVSVRAITGGFKLLANRLFTLSEQTQAYRYEMFSVSASANEYDFYIFTAFFLLGIIILICIAVTVKYKSRLLCLGAWMLFFFIQIYLGVFPAPAWNAALCTALFFVTLCCQNRGNAIILSAVVMCLAVLTAIIVYSGPNPILYDRSESIRDLFDEKIERPITAAVNPQQPLSDAMNNNIDMRKDITGTGGGSSGGQSVETEFEDGFSGSQIGTAAGQRLWVLWVILALFAAAFIVWFFALLAKARKRRVLFESPDIPVAVNSMFLYLMQWLAEFGLKTQGHAYSENTGQLETLFSEKYSSSFSEAVKRWQESVYSEHELTGKDRAWMRAFMEDTIETVIKKSNRVQAMKIRIRLLFYGEVNPE